MRSIRIIILGMAVACVSITVEAQQKTLLQTEVMAKQLNLDAKQKAELDKHFKGMKSEREANQTKIKALRQEVQRDQFVKRQEQEAKLKSILTEEQFAKIQKQRKNVKGNKVRKGQQRGAQGNQRGKVRPQGVRNEMARDPEMRKKFQEFLELEKQKKEKDGGGN